MNPYLDTSALVPAYVEEQNSARVARFLAENPNVWISSLTEVEFVSALARRVRMKELSPERARQVVSVFDRHLAEGFYVQAPVLEETFLVAANFLKRFTTPLRSLDALHLACCATEQKRLVTFDAVLAQCARELGVECLLLGQETPGGQEC